MKTPYQLPYESLPKDTPFTQTKNPLAECHRKSGPVSDVSGDEKPQMVWIWTWGRAAIYGGSNRLQRGRAITWQGDAKLFSESPKRGDTSWNVTASDGRRTYVVRMSGDGKRLSCECKDEPPEGQLCKHRYAVAIEALHGNYYTPWEELNERQKSLRLNLVLLLQTESKPKANLDMLRALENRFGGGKLIPMKERPSDKRKWVP